MANRSGFTATGAFLAVMCAIHPAMAAPGEAFRCVAEEHSINAGRFGPTTRAQPFIVVIHRQRPTAGLTVEGGSGTVVLSTSVDNTSIYVGVQSNPATDVNTVFTLYRSLWVFTSVVTQVRGIIVMRGTCMRYDP